MERVKVLVTTDMLQDEHLRRICGVSERVTVEKRVGREKVLESVKDAEVLVGWLFDKDIFRSAKRLKWFHTANAGVGMYLFPEFVESSVILTNSSGIHRNPMAEVAMAFILCFAKNLPGFMKLKAEKKWAERGFGVGLRATDELTGRTLGVVGLGNVGMEVAWRGKCFGMRVVAVDRVAIRRPTYVDEAMGLSDLIRFLGESDYLVLTVPLTSDTRHMIGEKELRHMKTTAYLINICRGAVVDEKALVKALKERWIAGAGLDVFEKEPLPSNSELWDMENVIITPHMSGWTPYYPQRLTELFCNNLRRYLEGRPLKNLVDKKVT